MQNEFLTLAYKRIYHSFLYYTSSFMKAILFVIFSLVVLQTTSAQQSRLDSTITYKFITPTDSVLEYKYEYAYDNKGKRTSYVGYRWNATENNWINSSKNEYAYDDKGNETLSAYYDWNADKNDWVGRYKRESINDDKGKGILYANFYWNATKNDWVRSYKYEYAYDVKENIIFSAYYNWDTIKNEWVAGNKSEYTYDDKGNQTLYVSYDWSVAKNEWLVNSKSESTYDDKENQALSAHYNWNPTKNEWVVSYKFESNYDDKGNITLYSYYKWDTTKNEWVAQHKYEYAYNDKGKETLYVGYNWNANINAWVGRYKSESTYDDKGRETNSVDYNWDTTNNQWVKVNQWQRVYDKFNNLVVVIFELEELPQKRKEYYYYTYFPANAQLASIRFNDATQLVFNKDTLNYVVVAASDTTKISAIAVDSSAFVKIQQAKDLYAANEKERTASIVVTGADGINKQTYTVVFQRIILGNETTPESGVLAYPNPCTDVLYFEASPQASIRFVDILGQVKPVPFTRENNKIKADVKHLPKGVYLLSVGKNKTQRFVKE
jgi:Secretion system C-terminal sorting domain/Family of unknown function (DUF3836)